MKPYFPKRRMLGSWILCVCLGGGVKVDLVVRLITFLTMSTATAGALAVISYPSRVYVVYDIQSDDFERQ